MIDIQIVCDCGATLEIKQTRYHKDYIEFITERCDCCYEKAYDEGLKDERKRKHDYQ